MSYLDESRLSTYDSNLKEWISSQDSKTITPSIYPWTKTAKAGAVSCYPVSGTELKPVVDFLFTETPPASGDKGPENPSTIAGVSSATVTRCGKNLLRTDNLTQVPNVGLSITVNEDGTISASGSTPSNSGCHLYFFNPTASTDFGLPDFFVPGKTYTSSLSCNDINMQFAIYFHNGTSWSSPYYDNCTFTVPTNAVSCMIRVSFPSETTFNGTAKIQIEEDSAATVFEPYAGTDYTLPLGSTYYGGTLDVASGVMTVTFASIVIDGTTTYSSSAGVTEGTNFYRLGLYPSIARKNSAIASYSACNTLPINDGDNFIRLANNSYKIEVQLQKSLLNLGDGESYSVVQSAFQTFFSAYPTTVVYPVSTPYTVQLTPTSISSLAQTDKYTPRLNTIYTDASAVQVGYVKSPIREEFELQQAIVSQGGEI